VKRTGTKKTGLLCVVSSPSGGGKTTVIRTLLQRHPEYGYSISATTRAQRLHERHGEDYYFLSDAEFDRMIACEQLIEWAEVHGYRYGTPKEPIAQMLQAGRIVLLAIDVIGGMNVRKFFPQQSLLIFLKPPSLVELKRRLLSRKSETNGQIQKRLERLPLEMSYSDRYDVQIINRDFQTTVTQVEQVIQDYKTKLEA